MPYPTDEWQTQKICALILCLFFVERDSNIKCTNWMNHHWLVVSTPLKNMLLCSSKWVHLPQVGDENKKPNRDENKKSLKPPTRSVFVGRVSPDGPLLGTKTYFVASPTWGVPMMFFSNFPVVTWWVPYVILLFPGKEYDLYQKKWYFVDGSENLIRPSHKIWMMLKAWK